jgi:hypothetical protein
MSCGDPVAAFASGYLVVRGVAGLSRRFFNARLALCVPAHITTLAKKRNPQGIAKSAALCGLCAGRWAELMVKVGGGKKKTKLGGEVVQA